MLYKDRKILVSGASSGLGAHMVGHLASNGAHVVAAARRAAALDALAAEHETVTALAMDVSDAASASAGVAAAADAMGGLDGLVNNAGIAWGGRAVDIAAVDWDRVIDVNLSGVFRVAQAAARIMAAGGGGAIVNTASILGLQTGAGVAAYATSKAGVVHLTKTLALEWARYGVRVNALAPGYFPTDINRAFLESPEGDALKKGIPMRRFGMLTDLDGPLDLLLGPGGAFVTGVTLPVDGGHLCRPL